MTIPVVEYITNGVTETGSSGTIREDLPVNEQILDLMIELRITNSSTVLNTRSILDVITSIEVVSGGKRIFSLEPELASYAAFVVRGGKLPDHRFFHGAGAVQRLHLPIYFGRKPLDTRRYLDTSLYKNPQLVIDWSMDTTYENSGSLQHTITYRRPLQKLPSAEGYVRWRELKEELSGASAQTIRHDLPTDFPYFYLACRIEDDDQDINTDLDEVEVNFDSGRAVILDVDGDEINFYDRLRWGFPRGYINQPVVTGQATCRLFADWPFVDSVVPIVEGARIPTVTSIAGEQGVITVYTDAGAQATDAIPVAVDARSPNPHKCLTLIDGRETPFPAPDYGEGWVDFKQNAYAITYHTFVAELVPGGV